MKAILRYCVSSLTITMALVAGAWIDPETCLVWDYAVSGSDAIVTKVRTLTGVSPVSGIVLVPSVVDGRKVKGVGKAAFVGTKVTDVVIPEGVETIGEGAFSNCTTLVSAKLPTTLTRIDKKAFYGCLVLQEMRIPNSVTEIGEYAFYFTCLSSVVIPSKVREVKAGTFHSCNALKLLSISEGVTNIGYTSFYACNQLTSVMTPQSLVSIGDFAFGEASKLETIIISRNVEKVGSWAFSGCNKLTRVDFEGAPPAVWQDAQINGNVTLRYNVVFSNAWDNALSSSSYKNTRAYTPDHIERLRYCVIDLTGGAAAESFPVYYLADAPINGWGSDFKWTFLVLRRIHPTGFVMGDENSVENPAHTITLTKPYYMGVFETTQLQYSLVMGVNPVEGSSYTQLVGADHPVSRVSYEMIRGSDKGSQWPVSSAVDETSFIGVLRKKTGMNFDLPTEAQWECACRAGTKSAYNNGGDTEADLSSVGVYNAGLKGYSRVGSLLPNAWGLYDMHGNVWEWCLDWGEGVVDVEDTINPKGKGSGVCRVERGGCFYGDDEASWCRSFCRADENPTLATEVGGFRLSLTIADAIPDLGETASDDAVVASLRDAADPKLPERITSAGAYCRFRDWSAGVLNKIGVLATPEGVKTSPFAWQSFALATARLLEKPVGENDILIESFTQGTLPGMYKLTLSLNGVDVGGAACGEDLQKVVSIGGSDRIALDSFSADNVRIESVGAVGDKITFELCPVARRDAYFFKVGTN